LLAEVPIALILLGLVAYTVLGGADFGAGFWQLLAPGERGREVREHAHHAMAPVWEANHVWLIFILVILWTAYPVAFGSVMSTLALPLFVAAVGIVLRGMAYAMRAGARTEREVGRVDLLFAASSVLTPLALGTAVGAIASGRVPVGNARGGLFDSWLHTTPLFVGALGVAVSAYLAAVYLAGDAVRAGREDLATAFRRRALAAGLVAGTLAGGGLLVVHDDAPKLWDGLTSGAGLGAVIASGAAGLATLALLYRRRFAPARFAAALAVAGIVAGWVFAQEPDLLPGLPVRAAAAPHSTLVALIVSVAGGMLVLVPSLLLLYGQVLAGRFEDSPHPTPQSERTTGSPARARVALPAALGAVGLPLALFGGSVGEYAGFALLLGFVAAGALTLLGPALEREDDAP
jgi:cytochrome d ubiquinol oxidase subunit II